ncbi:MAG: HipA domain-containing protein [Coriobacteriales bacterium]
MTSAASELDLYIAGALCGVLSEDRDGKVSFEYDPSYSGAPLSLSMPVGIERFGDRVVRPFLMGLLPDEAGTRSAIGARYGVSGNNPFRLLGVLGSDCPGAVQVCPSGTEPPPQDDPSCLVALSEDEIGQRLAAIREDAAVAWLGGDPSEGHWSLGGCQAKLALRRERGRWHECAGAAATTHILKPGVTGMSGQAFVEFLSMKAASKIGLPCAAVEYSRFGDEQAVVIERYDRLRDHRGLVVRLHQEDLCQALGVSPEAKYADQGGPNSPRILELLKATGLDARENVYRFILYTFFNYLIGATDAHAKNHSLLLTAQGARLAPLYDVASIAPYRSLLPSKRRPLRAALSIGGENRFGMVGAGNIESMVRNSGLEELGLGSDLLKRRMEAMARVVPGALAEAAGEARLQGIEGVDGIASKMLDEIEANCRRTLERL